MIALDYRSPTDVHNSICWIIIIAIEMTCQRENGGCDQVCEETETGVNCSCYDGYQPVDNQTCTGMYTSYSSYVTYVSAS